MVFPFLLTLLYECKALHTTFRPLPGAAIQAPQWGVGRPEFVKCFPQCNINWLTDIELKVLFSKWTGEELTCMFCLYICMHNKKTKENAPAKHHHSEKWAKGYLKYEGQSQPGFSKVAFKVDVNTSPVKKKKVRKNTSLLLSVHCWSQEVCLPLDFHKHGQLVRPYARRQTVFALCSRNPQWRRTNVN